MLMATATLCIWTKKDDGDKIMFVDINGSPNDIDPVQQGTGEHFLDVSAVQ